ncbi:hypothetical protein SRB5_10560 [Streptomyces sp. RB5]|uniref:Uncharacterized protein n=1 Tax=Streptomyces smaragdinus TaxID=2585196 RepID=A0A7K0CCT7_9ACTN|nr:hypothetical protein [Streptomyces smaragdinus]MQY10942.1 hypothetical protein [Streptomyces smaragdinus]
MGTNKTLDDAAAARRARFGTLPARIAFTDMVEETSAAPKATDSYDPEAQWKDFNCLARDLGL